MSQDNIFLYSLRDESNDEGFVLVASDKEIDVEKVKTDKVPVFHLETTNGKGSCFLLEKKASKVKLDLIVSLIDSSLFKYASKTRIATFTKKNYDQIVTQIKEDLEEEDESSEEEEEAEEVEVEVKPKRGRPAAATKAAVTETKQKKQEKAKTDAKKSKKQEIVKKSKDEEEEEEEEEEVEEEEEEEQVAPVKQKRGRGRAAKLLKQSQEVEKESKESEQEAEEEEDEPKPKSKRGRKPNQPKKTAKEDIEDDNKGDDEEEDKKEEESPKPKKGKKNVKASESSDSPVEKKRKSRKSKKAATEEEEEEEEDDEEEDKQEEEPGSQKSKKGKKKSVSSKFKKGQNNPNITKIAQVDDTFEGESLDIQDNCCSFCTNHELIRAINTGNHALLKKLINSKSKISTLFAKRGPDTDQTTLELILMNKDKKGLEIFLDGIQKIKELSFASLPECSLDEVNTGHNDRFAYGVPTRRVNCSRGGKEGNNAFVADLNSYVDNSSWSKNMRLTVSLLENETEVQLLEFLRGLKDSEITNSLLEKAYIAVRAGNRKTAAYLIEKANKIGGYGFNKVHEQVLSLDSPAKMEEFRKVSATKKSTGSYQNNDYGYGSAQGVITPIHCAAINPNPDFIKKLLDLAPEFSIPDDMMRKPVHYSAACEGPGPLSYLIKQGVDTREGDKKKITPLMLASQYGRAKNIEVLLEANGKSNPDAKTRDGMRAIHYAAYYGHLDCVKLLVEKGGVAIDSTGAKRMTPLHMASARGHFELVEYLLNNGSKVTLKDKFKRSAVILATANGHLKILSLLLMKGGPFNDPDSSNNSPVHYAAAGGFQSCLDLLKLAGADFNPQNSWNLTPLSVAMAKGHFGMVKKLLNYPECDVNCTDVKGRTIISRATQNLNQKSLPQFEFILKEKKANPNMSDLQGQSPLHYLCGLSKSQYVAKRQKEENKLNIVTKYEQEYEQIVEKAIKILLECGADINKLNLLEQSPIYIAIKNRNFFVLKLLIAQGGINFGFVNQIDQNILHSLKSLILEGPKGIEQLYEIFSEIKKDGNHNIKDMLNLIDYNGFTPLLSYVRQFSSGATSYWDQVNNRVKQEMFEKKGGVKKEGQQYKAHKLADFGNDGALVQLTTEELQQAEQQASEELLQYEQEFQKLILFLQEEGANVNDKVAKLKKFRTKMDVEENKNEEQPEDEDEYDMWGNLVQKTKLKYKSEYCTFGGYNIFSFALNHLSLPYLKFFTDNFPQLSECVDYLGRNLLTRFVVWNNDSRTFDGRQTNPLEILSWLCSLKIDINHTDMAQQTPLISSIILNRQSFAKILIENGANLQVKDFFGNTPLIMSINKIVSNDLNFVQYLLEHGADTNFQDNDGRMSLHHAVNKADKGANASFDLENLLLKNKANVNAVDLLGRTPLHYAFVAIDNESYSNNQYDPFETVSSLCNQQGIKIDAKDNLGKTPLHYASQKNSTISAIYMLEKGAKIDEEDINGNTPLGIAFRFQRSEITTTFVQKSADTSKMITIKEEDKQGENEEDDEEEDSNNRPKKTKARRQRAPFRQAWVNYGNRNLNQNGDQDNVYYNQGSPDKESIVTQLLAEEVFKEDTFLKVISDLKEKEEKIAKGEGIAKFSEFKNKGSLQVGKHSFFKAAISYQWQGIAYLLLIKSSYNLFNALEDAINLDLYQLSITLLNKYPEDKTVANVNSQKQNLLHILCKRSSKDINLQIKLLETLVSRNVDHLQTDVEQNLPLHYASSHTHLITQLLELSPQCNQLNKEENTPFTIALQRDAKNALRTFKYYKPNLQQNFKAKPTDFNNKLLYTPFIYLVANKTKDLNLLQNFLDDGSNVNEVDEQKRNSLFYAIYHNSEKLVKFILQNKDLDINHVDSHGKNAVHYVVNPTEFGSYENKQILQILKERGFDLNVKDNEGNTPFSYSQLQDSKTLENQFIEYGLSSTISEKKLPKRAPTSIVASANFPEEEVDFEEDSKKFCEDPVFDEYKEFFEQRNKGDKIQLDKHVTPAYKKKENYVILDDNNEAYNLLMTKVDLGFGGYSKYVFYIMQIIFEKNSGVYILYTRWGAMGQPGQMQHTPFPTKEAAVKEFSKIFSQKSGNEWTDRHQFKKQDKKYQLIVFDNEDNKKAFAVKPYDFDRMKVVPTTLDKPIYKFVENISKAEVFKQAYRQLAVSDYYLPLTKLSKAALIEAQGILADLKDYTIEIEGLRKKLTEANNLQDLIEREENVLKLSNRYYELVPRATSRWEPAQPLNNQWQIQNEQRLIENLLDFEAAIKIIMGSYSKISIEHPIDYCFNALNIRMKSIEIDHPEFKMIREYIGRTNSAVLQEKSKAIHNIFAVERRGEAERIKQFDGYTKKLLWHGSGVQNFLSILSFGLRINGIQAQKSGSSLGEGIYFADLYTKASAYANNNNVGVESKFLLLCEVAVGKEQLIKTNEHYQQFTQHNHQLLKGFNSVKLVGKQCPDEKRNLILANGTIAPIGPIIDYNVALQQKLASKGTQKKSPKQPKSLLSTSANTLGGGAGFVLNAVPRKSVGGKAPRKQLATKAARKSVPAQLAMKAFNNDDSNDDDDQSDEESQVVNEPVKEESEDEDNEERDQEDEDDEDNGAQANNLNLISNQIYNIPEKKKVPFDQILTDYHQSEYVVFNTAQVRIRYLVEIRD